MGSQVTTVFSEVLVGLCQSEGYKEGLCNHESCEKMHLHMHMSVKMRKLAEGERGRTLQMPYSQKLQ